MVSQNTLIYKEAWTTRYQEELDEPVKWKDICRVDYTDTRVLHNPYITDITVQGISKGSQYSYQTVTRTDDSITINDGRIAPVFIDRADLAFTGYDEQMELAARHGVLLNEAIESAVYAAHSGFTDFDNASIGGAAGNITVSTGNIDEICTGIVREIREANGESLYQRNGGFVVWRPADFEKLQQFAMSTGFSIADAVLKNGVVQAFPYAGLTHYSSNLLASGHVFAGVKKVLHLGILKDTYGQIMVDEKDPNGMSGISVVGRVDFAVKVWNKVSAVLFDVTVA